MKSNPALLSGASYSTLQHLPIRYYDQLSDLRVTEEAKNGLHTDNDKKWPFHARGGNDKSPMMYRQLSVIYGNKG
jgi:hypothetical protein